MGPFLAEPAKGWLLTQRGLTSAEAFGGVAIEYLLYTLVSGWMAAIALAVLISRGALPVLFRIPVAGTHAHAAETLTTRPLRAIEIPRDPRRTAHLSSGC